MRVRTHLISMPWAPPGSPSIQLGALQAHLRRALGPAADCRSYSAFFSIAHALAGGPPARAHQSFAAHGEDAYLALYLRRFRPGELSARGGLPRLLRALAARGSRPLAAVRVRALEEATRRYLDGRVGPALLARGLNLVGFTVNYDQLYASLYAAEHLRRAFPGRRLLFVFGGCSAGQPAVLRLLGRLGVPGLVALGEGEGGLERLVRALQARPDEGAAPAPDSLAGLDPGLLPIGAAAGLADAGPAQRAGQLPGLGDLPLPDYGEYFTALRAACRDLRTYRAFRAETRLHLEGSRGCFGRCDFCGLNRTWRGFRTRSGAQNLAAASALMRGHGSSQLEFVDSACDAWAEEYARRAVATGVRPSTPMELRAGHSERFWALLALAGVRAVQIGVEALSAPLLRAMRKGTTVTQVLVALKCLAELGLERHGNLILQHPASTLADVRETRRILRQIPHWGPLWPVRFALMAGSPAHQALPAPQRRALRPLRALGLPVRLARYAVGEHLEVPPSLLPTPAVRRAWRAFAVEAQEDVFRQLERPARLEVARVAPGALRVTDTREGAHRVHELAGADARVHDLCHAGAEPVELAAATGLSPAAVEAALRRLSRARLLLRVEGRYLALALRPRDELVRGLLASGEAPAPLPALSLPGAPPSSAMSAPPAPPRPARR